MRNIDTYVIASATEPWKMDSDIVEHFPVRVRTMLPDDPSRALIFSIHLTGADSTEVDMEKMVSSTMGFMGKQIARACYDALNAMLMEQNPGMEEVNVRTLQKEVATRPLRDEDRSARENGGSGRSRGELRTLEKRVRRLERDEIAYDFLVPDFGMEQYPVNLLLPMFHGFHTFRRFRENLESGRWLHRAPVEGIRPESP